MLHACWLDSLLLHHPALQLAYYNCPEPTAGITLPSMTVSSGLAEQGLLLCCGVAAAAAVVMTQLPAAS